MLLCSFKYLEFSNHFFPHFIPTFRFVLKKKNFKYILFHGYCIYFIFPWLYFILSDSACLVENNTWYPPSVPPLCPATMEQGHRSDAACQFPSRQEVIWRPVFLCNCQTNAEKNQSWQAVGLGRPGKVGRAFSSWYQSVTVPNWKLQKYNPVD